MKVPNNKDPFNISFLMFIAVAIGWNVTQTIKQTNMTSLYGSLYGLQCCFYFLVVREINCYSSALLHKRFC